MKKIIWLCSALVFSVVLIGCGALYQDKNQQTQADIKMVPAVGEIPQRLELEQAWNEKTRMKFWFTSQGSQIMPYTWFTWLEQSDNTELFRSAQHMESLRYLPMAASMFNPSGLPIGFAFNKNSQ